MAKRIVEPTDESHRVTTLELFFDLVFVFGLTQITALMATTPTPLGVLQGLIVLALLWFGWAGYAWLGNQAKADEGAMRLAVVAAMGALFVVGLAIPASFGNAAADFIDPLVFALFYCAVRTVHWIAYLIAANGDSTLRRQATLTFAFVLPSFVLLIVGSLLSPGVQVVMWGLAVVAEYAGVYFTSNGNQNNGWQLVSAGHFAERHGLIIIIALGESIVAVSAGIGTGTLTWAAVLGALFGLAVALCLWWLYFDVVSLVAERVLTSKTGRERAKLAADSYTFLHVYMVAGIVLFAFGLKKAMQYIVETADKGPGYPLSITPLVALYGGVALYLLAHVAFRKRNISSVNKQRVTVAVFLLLVIPVTVYLPVLLSLGVLAVILLILVSYEVIRFRDARHDIRHRKTQSGAADAIDDVQADEVAFE